VENTKAATMTERTGRPARWSTALLATPAAAVVFTAATAWSISNQPVANLSSDATPTIEASQPSAEAEAIRRSLADDAARVADLQDRLKLLRRQAAVMGASGKKAAAQAAAAQAAARSASNNRSGSSNRSSGGTANRAPAAHVATGASGAKR
jgi:hypothetical protein